MSDKYNEDDAVVTPSMLLEALTIQIRARNATMIKGAPGVGKTDIVTQASKESNASIVPFHPVVSDPTDPKGMPVYDQSTGEAKFVAFGDLKKLIDTNTLTVAFLDDLGQAPPAVQAAFMQLILGREINGHKISDKVVFIAATNRKQDKAHVSGILEPVKSRFVTILELKTDLKDWLRWANRERLPHEVISFIKLRPQFLNDFVPTSNMTNSPSPRTIHNMSKLEAAGIPKHLEYPMFSGAVGSGCASEYIGFKKIYKQIPDPDYVINRPEAAPIPEEPSAMYALCGALSARATPTNFEMIVKYANRIDDDFSAVMVLDCIDRNNDCMTTPAFIRWTADHADFMY